MSQLTDSERAFLRELKADARWNAILTKLARSTPPEYQPGASFEDWVYNSGLYRGNIELIHILSQE